jgi:transcriptional regulator GlxA family with amidase domain
MRGALFDTAERPAAGSAYGRRTPTRVRREQLYAEALDVIERRHSEPLDVDGLARAVFASRRQLQRVFAEVGGTTIRDAIARARLERAAELLRADGGRVKDVATAVGVAPAAQFAKAFRRRFGVPPSEYRRRSA